MATQPVASRAHLFMRQCRSRQCIPPTYTTNKTTARSVSSSHLAPSTFSKPLRTRMPLPEQQEERRLPNRFRPSRRSLDSSTSSSFSPSSDQKEPNNLPPPITEIARPHIPNTFFSYLKYNILKLPMPKRPVTNPPFNVLNNPYKARKSWPPDFRLLNSKQQFHFEKLYRRRLLTKTLSQRVNWNKYTYLLQQTLIVLTLLYFLFMADPYADVGGGTPVDGFRAWFFGKVAEMDSLPRDWKEQAAEAQVYYQNNWDLQPWKVLKKMKQEDDERLAARAKAEAGEAEEKTKFVGQGVAKS